MAEYIEREAVMDMFMRYGIGWGNAKVKGVINSIPAVDVRPVVLCQACKHWEIDWTPNGVSDGRHYCAPLDLYPSADWFCADGEKKEES